MNIFLCDDDPVYLQALYDGVSAYMAEHHLPYAITSCTDPAQALSTRSRFDIAFLDIQIGEQNGISVAEALREQNEKLILFFITNFDAYQDDAMDLQAFRFFTKPFSQERLRSGLDKAMEYLDGTQIDLYLSGSPLVQGDLIGRKGVAGDVGTAGPPMGRQEGPPQSRTVFKNGTFKVREFSPRCHYNGSPLFCQEIPFSPGSPLKILLFYFRIPYSG